MTFTRRLRPIMCSNRICRLSRSRISAACLLMVSLSFKFQRTLGLLIHFFSLFFGPSAGTTMYLFIYDFVGTTIQISQLRSLKLHLRVQLFTRGSLFRWSPPAGFLTAPLWCINPENNLIELSYIAAPALRLIFSGI